MIPLVPSVDPLEPPQALRKNRPQVVSRGTRKFFMAPRKTAVVVSAEYVGFGCVLRLSHPQYRSPSGSRSSVTSRFQGSEPDAGFVSKKNNPTLLFRQPVGEQPAPARLAAHSKNATSANNLPRFRLVGRRASIAQCLEQTCGKVSWHPAKHVHVSHTPDRHFRRRKRRACHSKTEWPKEIQFLTGYCRARRNSMCEVQDGGLIDHTNSARHSRAEMQSQFGRRT